MSNSDSILYLIITASVLVATFFIAKRFARTPEQTVLMKKIDVHLSKNNPELYKSILSKRGVDPVQEILNFYEKSDAQDQELIDMCRKLKKL